MRTTKRLHRVAGCIGAAVVVTLIVAGGVVSAQDTLDAYFPEVSILGEDWQVGTMDPNGMDADLSVFAGAAGAAGAVYAGPNGARVVVIALRPGSSRFAAWEEADDLFAHYWTNIAWFADVTENGSAVGCNEVKTATGTDNTYQYPGAVILCARAEAEVFLVIAASGKVSGLTGLGAAHVVLTQINRGIEENP